MENTEEDHLPELGLQVDAEVTQHLKNSAKWGKFIAIIMFVVCALLLVLGIIKIKMVNTILSRLTTSSYFVLGEQDDIVLIALVVVLAGMLAASYFLLLNFSVKIKKALQTDNVTELNAGLKSLKVFFIITTAFAMIGLVKDIIDLVKYLINLF
jgi:hypothetical protein